MEYEAVIGLEVHAQLLTRSKLFCGCATVFGSPPNTQVCPVCLGMPGVLPVINEKAVEYAIKMALATECRINERSVFARKNYFYPDLPKGYQISQYDEPLAEGGHIDIETADGKTKRIGITRIHIEEDAGKLLHGEGDGEASLVDFNRAGMPLIEIVSEPHISTPEEAVSYLKALRDILLYLEICDGNMQEGSLRCDANVSVRPVGSKEFGTKTEVKNMNSFKFLKDALTYEIGRQISLLESGERVVQETRLFEPSTGKTRSMRSKEEAHDYRYFPEPDLLPLVVEQEEIEAIMVMLPELPAQKKERFMKEYGLPSYDAGILTSSKRLADFYEECVRLFEEPKTISNWIMSELLRLLKEHNISIEETPIGADRFTALLKLVREGKISGKIGKEVLEEMFATGKDAQTIIEEKGLSQISDESELLTIIDKILEENPENVERYRAGKTKLIGFFVGEVMKATRGKANPQLVNKLLKERLDK
ncbi:MAG TPA: Asp-tRNA(Asn)/Glu-tRNA(Gln) amidotransferase subunit GatB [Deltaproteobacteria bacterium]|nr:Asp-tRNA(Asn)/Glu-tRNA(Gln) amidotransferase subunit GatB [Deltaproteobacteria bacterium]